MKVFVLNCVCHDAYDGEITTTEVFSTLEKAKAELGKQFNDTCSEGNNDSYFAEYFASVTNCDTDSHCEWDILEREVK